MTQGNLVMCPDCGVLVSRHAESCPQCGRPRTAAAAAADAAERHSKSVQTIEATGKKWKLLQALGIVLMLAGALALLGALFAPVFAPSLTLLAGIIGGIALALGVPLLIAGRAGGWWFHG